MKQSIDYKVAKTIVHYIILYVYNIYASTQILIDCRRNTELNQNCAVELNRQLQFVYSPSAVSTDTDVHERLRELKYQGVWL